MILALKKYVIRLLEKRGYLLINQSDKDRILRLIEKLKPVGSVHPLIRLGAENDGGYLIPDDFEGIEACFSPGVDQNSSFERDIAKRGIALYLADFSVDRVGDELINFNYDFEKKFIASFESESHTTLSNWVQNKGPFTGDLLLQMDIEGAEYECLIHTPKSTIEKFRIICIEFHHIASWFDPSFLQFAEIALNKLTESHRCVHIHPNNTGHVKTIDGIVLPNTMEFTFLRRDRITETERAHEFPHPLDRDCVSTLTTIVLPPSWQ